MMVMMIVWLEFDGISVVSWQRNSVSHDLTSWKCLAARFDFIHLSLMPLLSKRRRNFCTKLDETFRGVKTLVVSSHSGATQLPLLMRRNSARTIHATYPAHHHHHDDDGVESTLLMVFMAEMQKAIRIAQMQS